MQSELRGRPLCVCPRVPRDSHASRPCCRGRCSSVSPGGWPSRAPRAPHIVPSRRQTSFRLCDAVHFRCGIRGERFGRRGWSRSWSRSRCKCRRGARHSVCPPRQGLSFSRRA
eukprot:Amastigsp_a510640_56.p3 type:complete len:113 gc:universal Amastigsp_a510640_56:168-506(+)